MDSPPSGGLSRPSGGAGWVGAVRAWMIRPFGNEREGSSRCGPRRIPTPPVGQDAERSAAAGLEAGKQPGRGTPAVDGTRRSVKRRCPASVDAPLALGEPPEVVSETFTIMVWAYIGPDRRPSCPASMCSGSRVQRRRPFDSMLRAAGCRSWRTRSPPPRRVVARPLL